jgi:DNA-binding MarR family transcriptional regulator
VSPSKDDVLSMVVALFTLSSGLERARRQKKAAASLDLLQVIAASETMRPSDIADQRFVHRSLVTRQLRELEDAGYVQFAADPRDGRSWMVALTPAGRDEMLRLQNVGLERFAMFVAGWQPGEVQQLTALLDKLAASMAAVTDQETQAVRSERGPRSRSSRHASSGQP